MACIDVLSLLCVFLVFHNPLITTPFSRYRLFWNDCTQRRKQKMFHQPGAHKTREPDQTRVFLFVTVELQMLDGAPRQVLESAQPSLQSPANSAVRLRSPKSCIVKGRLECLFRWGTISHLCLVAPECLPSVYCRKVASGLTLLPCFIGHRADQSTCGRAISK